MAIRKKDRASQVEPVDIEKVMGVAGRLFAEHGCDGVGVRLIAKKSGMSMPTIFYYFGSKSSLYAEVLGYKYRAIAELTLPAMQAMDDPVKRLECMIEAFYGLLLQDRTLLLLLHRDIVDVIAHKRRPAFADEYSRTYSLFCTLLEAALGRPVERRVVFPLVSLIQGFCELTAIMNERDFRKTEEALYDERLDGLIDASKRICSI